MTRKATPSHADGGSEDLKGVLAGASNGMGTLAAVRSGIRSGGALEFVSQSPWWAWPVVGACVSVMVCLLVAHQMGFPLDDAWIHQDFARTLATTGRFAFQPGKSGAGSTSPLWVLLLTPPYLLFHGNPPLALVIGWSSALGASALAGLGIVAGAAAGDLVRGRNGDARAVWLARTLAGTAVVTEWHLVWAAVSGMETDLLALVALGLILGVSRGARAGWLGLVAAAAITIRPEGSLVVGLVIGGAIWQRWTTESRGARRSPGPSSYSHWLSLARSSCVWLAPFVATLLLGLAPYAWLNVAATGNPLPSTFYAKAAFYGSGTAGAAAGYFGQVLIVLVMSSIPLVVLGGLSYSHGLLSRRGVSGYTAGAMSREAAVNPRALLQWLLWLWPVALIAAYAVHLPVAYQHARYQMPALAPLIALGAAGVAPLLVDRRRQLLAGVGAGIFAVASVLSMVRGAQIYAANVRYIDAFQVKTALWIRAHTSRQALIATHDVGAIGYFSNRRVLDMAGLIDPEVMSRLGNQAALETFLSNRHAAYVVMFIDWFPPPATLAHDLAPHLVFRARSPEFSSGPDTEFVVYRTGW